MFNIYVGFKTTYPSRMRRIRVDSLRIRLNEMHGRAFILTDVHVQDTSPFNLIFVCVCKHTNTCEIYASAFL